MLTIALFFREGRTDDSPKKRFLRGIPWQEYRIQFIASTTGTTDLAACLRNELTHSPRNVGFEIKTPVKESLKDEGPKNRVSQRGHISYLGQAFARRHEADRS